jgi:hypothetical protein
MSTKITLEYFGFQGQGATVKEAKQDAGRKIDALHQGTWEPVIVTWRGETVLIHRTLEGWLSRFLQHKDEPLKVSTGCQFHGTDDLKAVIRSVQSHVVQLGWTFEDPIDLFPDFFTNEADRREAISYRQWQIAYRKFKAEGHSDNDAHRLASESRFSRQGLSA